MKVISTFADGNFNGWTCGKVQACGKWGNICGGHNSGKGAGEEITKTFTGLDPGKYTVTMDFMMIDSWFVCSICSVRL